MLSWLSTYQFCRQTGRIIFTVWVEELQSVLNSIAGSQPVNLLLLLDEGNEGRPLHLHWLAGPVVHGDDEVEKVWFSQVGGGLLLKVSSAYSRGPGRKWIFVKFGFQNEIDPNKICQWILNGEYLVVVGDVILPQYYHIWCRLYDPPHHTPHATPHLS